MAIHPTAIIDASAEISTDAVIGPFCVIGPRVSIGARTTLMERVSVVKNTILGEDNLVYPGTVLGGDPQDKKFQGEQSWLRIGDQNLFRECVTVNRGTGAGCGETQIGNGNFLMASVHIAHDCRIGNEVTMANGVLLGGHIVVEDYVGFGGLSAVHHFVRIGSYAFVGGMTRVFHDAPPYMITEGQPARVRAVNRVGLRRNGMCDDTLHWLREAQRLLFFEGKLRDEACETLAERGPIPPEGEILLTFLRQSAEGKQGRMLQP